MPHLYLEPIGLSAGPAINQAIADGVALPLAGGPLGFLACKVIEGVPGRTNDRIMTAAQLKAARDADLRQLVERTTAPRAVPGLDLSRPKVMGIVNVTPDSFSDGGTHDTPELAITHARRLIAEGVDILDIGGESTRPGSDAVDIEIERARVLPVVEALKRDGVVISIDTRKSAIMRDACALGVEIVNDVSALTYDPQARATLAGGRAAVVLMHAQGEPKVMQDNPTYADVALDIHDELEARVAEALAAGIARERLIVDPGIGFGKTHQHNIDLMRRLAVFHGLGVPILLGASRKGFIGKITGVKTAGERVAGSVGVALAGLAQGVQIVRVHDVKETRDAALSFMTVAGFPPQTAGK